ncbi:hypothetical protein MARA_16460 [Mycolicibacterium arabiense]|uniref:Uncharacterized protein n=1 Tax=Mycolicibacterium arabiense TaxID=1286181 RepID=A0A7I7RUA7_9MYCO|nr:hypothetical protein MARA_16460 [Mycolicibacterium arabiense]
MRCGGTSAVSASVRAGASLIAIEVTDQSYGGPRRHQIRRIDLDTGGPRHTWVRSVRMESDGPCPLRGKV